MKEQMLAAVYRGKGNIVLESRPVPHIIDSRDAIVRVTRSSICTSDLHIRDGFVPRAKKGVVLGHEFVGTVVETGTDICKIKAGDRVAANCITFCGNCWYCRRGYINNCTYGGWELGCRIDGCQAEYVRVPFADMGLCKIPFGVSDENALFVGDILSSGYFGAELAQIREGDTVAVIGLGPVGLTAALCAKLLGAATVIGIDPDLSRCETACVQKAADMALSPLECNLEKEIKAHTAGRGADAVIEAAGGKDSFQTAWKIARPNAAVAIVAMYEENQILPLPQMYGKNLTFRTGGVDAVHCEKLLGWIAEKKLNTDFLITHRVPLRDILKGYQFFEEKGILESKPCMKVAVLPDGEGGI